MDLRAAREVADETAVRRRYVESPLGSLRIEGLELDSEARTLADRYIDGLISGDELTEALLSLR